MRPTVKGEKHFTASAWIITKKNPKKVLLIHHKKFDKWIQPGGHIEWNENPIEAVIREVMEETGLDISFLEKYLEQTIDGVTKFLRVPDYFLEQKISSYKDESEHFHLDFQYVIEANEQKLRNNILESHSIGWFTKKEALKIPLHEDTKMIIQQLLQLHTL